MPRSKPASNGDTDKGTPSRPKLEHGRVPGDRDGSEGGKELGRDALRCPIHGDSCPGDDGGFFFDGNHPDAMYPVI